MEKHKVFLVFLVACLLGYVVGSPEKCEKCIPKEMCDMYGEMNRGDQERWVKEHPCEMDDGADKGPIFGFAPTAKGDYVCCPYSNIWGVENPSKPKIQGNNDVNKNGNDGSAYNGDNLHDTQDSNRNHEDASYDKQSWRDRSSRYPGRSGGYGRNGHYHGRNPPRDQPLPTGNNFNPYGPIENQYNRPQYPSYNQNIPDENNGNFGRQNNNGLNTNVQPPNPQNGFNINAQPQPNLQKQRCSISILPPSPQSGCCGLDVAGDRTFGPQNNFMARPRQPNSWDRRRYPRHRFVRDVEAPSLDNRIAGGKETDLYQFPWTVHLKTAFDYGGGKKGNFNCGGSLISSRYVLTAAHCLKEDNAVLSKVDIYLAEFDKRTFPRDCVSSPEGQKCIENILTQSESVVVHPQFDDSKLQNDVALIRLRENVPFTEFTRPICLPPINIDNPEFSDLRLAVAGWGRNGSVPSDVKQSTVVNLVPQRQCKSYYHNLSKKHLCAAGKTGEDTCKGDSGGPLMMLYQGQYYVSGIVSGKRRDAPCGTAVPSLYTNVYQFNDWIQQNLRN